MWYAKNQGGYLNSSVEANANAVEIANTLYSHGWTKQAIAALLGNASYESGLNPWRWGDTQSLLWGPPSVAQFQGWTPQEAQDHGYGLLQYTRADKYINSTSASLYAGTYAPNFSDSPGNASDGSAQMSWFNDNGAGEWSHGLFTYYYNAFINYGVDITPWYYTTFNNFVNGVDNNGNSLSIDELTGVFELCYERPGDTFAANSYQTRVTYAQYWNTIIPNPPSPSTYRKMPWIFYLKHRRF